MTAIPAAGEFRTLYLGFCRGLMAWGDLDALVMRMRAEPEGWHVYETSGPPPTAPLAAGELPAALEGIVALLRRRHREDYLGFVYVDDPEAPRLVKVYDPNVASACAMPGAAPVPLVVVSRPRPEPLPLGGAAASGRPSLLRRLLGGGR